ncbi:MAG: peptidase [Thermoleophilia bacterium]|jgi:regulator of sigma E protease|nr:peptidase [Thermoleophilia bacterium]
MPYVLVIGALIVLVVLHELGHFLAARAVGIRATKFYVFFPPAIFKRTIRGVEYGIGSIPAGGFVKLPGMFEPVPGETAQRARWAVEDIDIAGHDDELVLDANLRSVESARSADAMVEPLREIDEVLQRQPASKQLRKARERVAGLVDDCHPQAYWRAALWRRMVVIFAGPLVNLVIALIALTAFYWALTPRYEATQALGVTAVTQGSPAEQAGFDEGSKITAWNGPVVGTDALDLQDRIIASTGKPVEVSWRGDDGASHTERLVPAKLDDEEQPRIGIQFDWSGVERSGYVDRPFGTGARIALEEMRAISWGNLTRLPQVFFDREIREDVGSVVGIVQVADIVDEQDRLLWYAGVISLILAVMNLLPLLPLDGGHLLFGLLEALRRRPLPRSVFERYSMVGLGLVLLLFFIGLDNDIDRSRG